MTQILLVRMSSLGDILHTFPAATDVRRALPHARLDWVVEEAYVPLVRMHPGVTRVIPFALRRWRRQLHRPQAWREMSTFRAALREQRYDAIVETQGLVKSAVVAGVARGPVHGFGPGTAREPWVSRFYDFRYEFGASDHKIERYRAVAARALGYDCGTSLDYGISAPERPSWGPDGGYCVLLHATARAAKLWPEEHWIEVGRSLRSRGTVCVLPWGNANERQRSERLAEGIGGALVPPAMPIAEAAGLIGNAAAVLGVDTGLMHLAAALRVPVVGIFCDSEPLDAQPLGTGATAYRGGVGKPPLPAEVLQALYALAPEQAA
jgi:heptosyltransferase-1